MENSFGDECKIDKKQQKEQMEICKKLPKEKSNEFETDCLSNKKKKYPLKEEISELIKETHILLQDLKDLVKRVDELQNEYIALFNQVIKLREKNKNPIEKEKIFLKKKRRRAQVEMEDLKERKNFLKKVLKKMNEEIKIKTKKKEHKNKANLLMNIKPQQTQIEKKNGENNDKERTKEKLL